MIFRKRAAAVFFVLSLSFAVFSMPFGAAISQVRLERNAAARVADDEKGVLQLKGFQNKSYDMNGSYSKFGSINNNSNQILLLTVTVNPEFTLNNLHSRFGVKIGSQTCEFRLGSSSPRQITLMLQPGQVMEVQAYFKQNLFSSLTIEFEFAAKDSSGTFSMQLVSTSRSPRRITVY